MSGSKKRSKYTLLSSDSDISNHEDNLSSSERTPSKNNCKATRRSRQIRKRVGSLNKHNTAEDHQPNADSNSISNGDQTTIENPVLDDDANEQQLHENIVQISTFVIENHSSVEEVDTTASTTDTDPYTATNDSPTNLTQTSMDQYFPSTENAFQQINSLSDNTLEFCIRCKIIYKSSIRHFGTHGKVFDAIVCDHSGEIKVVAFNDEVDRLFSIMNTNQTFIIKNGNVQIANDKFRSPYSSYEIRLLSTSMIEPYKCTNFKPAMTITKKTISHISQTLHGSRVDVEGIVIMDRGLITTTSEHTGQPVRRKSLKIKDETGATNITIWNDKIEQVPEQIMNKKIRIRNGKINHYNDYVSINISEQTIIEYY